MKFIRIVGLCLAAAFAFSAFAVSSASAADLLARPAGGGSIVGVTFLSTATKPKLVTKSGKEINCTHATNHGLFLTATLGDILIIFLGCTAKEGITVNCNTAGAGTGEIHLPLSTLFHLGLAHLGTNRSIPAAVILLRNAIKIECTSLVKIEVRGSVIGALQKANGEPIPLNTPTPTMNLNFQQTANGEQHLRLILMPGSTTPTTYDLESSFNGAAFELASEVANATLDEFTLPGGTKGEEIELVEP
jgi:hypothetical protein